MFTSNIFAILGLRALYFLLAGVAGRFHLLKYGLALVLIFVGAKMLVVDVYKIPIALALGVVAVVIGASVVASLLVRPRLEASRGAANLAARRRVPWQDRFGVAFRVGPQ